MAKVCTLLPYVLCEIVPAYVERREIAPDGIQFEGKMPLSPNRHRGELYGMLQ